MADSVPAIRDNAPAATTITPVASVPAIKVETTSGTKAEIAPEATTTAHSPEIVPETGITTITSDTGPGTDPNITSVTIPDINIIPDMDSAPDTADPHGAISTTAHHTAP